MKTKHLFLATALVASLAACTNEEIVSDVQQNVAAGRPTVDNVKLNFGLGADSRVSYDNGYQWNSTDVIGALLMDNVNPAWDHDMDADWSDKYTLTHHIHTSYPFTYADGEWSCNTKMLEGNYFFAWPWESYNGNRQVLHSLIDQKQTGIEKDVRPVSYAQNQFFIGYQRIMAGTEAQDVLGDVVMYPVLGGIQLQIVNTGTQTYHINKVVLSSDQLHSTLTFNPVYDGTNEDNVGYWYKELKNSSFNYANYLGLEDEKSYNKKATEDYSSAEALRAVVQPVANEAADGFVQLLIEGEEDARALEAEAGNTAYVMIMANAVEKVTDLKLAIYTDEGIVSNIDLTKINREIDAEKGASAITSAKVKAIGPNVVNTVKVQIDDNSFYTPTEINVYNENDLLQFIQWNVEEVGAREIVATIEKDVTFTEEMYELLTSNENITLGIVSKENTLTLDVELPTDFLDNEQLVFAAEFKNKETDATKEPNYDFDGDFAKIEILGDIVLSGDASEDIKEIVVAKNASLTIDSKKVKNVKIENNGKLTIGGNTKHLSAASKIENNNVMIVETDAIVAAEITNNADLELEDEAEAKEVKNAAEGEITLGEDSKLDLASNAGLVITEEGAVVTGNNAGGKIEYVTGAKVGNIGGIIYQEVEGPKTSEPTGTAATNVNTWYVVDDITIAADATIANIEVMGDHDILVNVPATGTAPKLTITGYLKINGSTTTEGKIDAGSIIVEEDGIWTNDGTINITTKNGLSNKKGEIENNGSVTLAYGSTPYAETTNETGYIAGEWDGNALSVSTDDGTEEQTALQAVVEFWWSQVKLNDNVVTDWLSRGYLNNNPYDVETMVNVIAYYGTTGKNATTTVTTLFNSNNWNLDLTGFNEAQIKNVVRTKLVANYSAFVAAVNEYVFDAENITAYTESTTVKLSTYKANYIVANTGKLKNTTVKAQDDYVYNSKDAAMRDFLGTLVAAPTTRAKYIENLVIFKNITTAEIATALEATNVTSGSNSVKGTYVYIWNADTCPLYKVVDEADDKKFSHWSSKWGVTSGQLGSMSDDLTIANVKEWIKGAHVYDANTVAGSYYKDVDNFNYTDGQVVAMFGNLAE